MAWPLLAGETVSEGGFKSGKVSKAALLGVEEASDKKGKPYYKYELLTTTGADGGGSASAYYQFSPNMN